MDTLKKGGGMRKVLLLFAVFLLPYICFATDVEVVVRGGGIRKIVIEVFTYPHFDSYEDVEKMIEKEHHSYKEIRTSVPVYTYMLKGVPDEYFVVVDVELIGTRDEEYFKSFGIELEIDGEYWFNTRGYESDSVTFRKR